MGIRSYAHVCLYHEEIKYDRLFESNPGTSNNCFYNSSLPGTHLKNSIKAKSIFVPVAICFKTYLNDISFFSNLFKEINLIKNFEISKCNNESVNNYRKLEMLNIFIYISSLIKPCSSSLFKMNLHFSSFEMYFSSQHEIPKANKSIKILFDSLELTTIIQLWISVLNEKHIILIANQNLLLFAVANALITLIFPFRWLHTFIPVLPNDLIEFLEAPAPYIMGISSLKTDFASIKENYPHHVICDINTSRINCNIQTQLPENEDFKLRKKISYLRNTSLMNIEEVFDNDYIIDSNLIHYPTTTNMFDSNSELPNFQVDRENRRNRNSLIINKKELNQISKFNSKTFFVFEDISQYRSFSENVQNIFFRVLRNPLENFEKRFLRNFEFDSAMFLESFSNDEYRDFWDKIIDTAAFEYFILSIQYLDNSNTFLFNNIVENEASEIYLSEVYSITANLPVSMTNVLCDLENQARIILMDSNSTVVDPKLSDEASRKKFCTEYCERCKKYNRDYNEIMSMRMKLLRKENERKRHARKVNFTCKVQNSLCFETYKQASHSSNKSFQLKSKLHTLFEEENGNDDTKLSEKNKEIEMENSPLIRICKKDHSCEVENLESHQADNKLILESEERDKNSINSNDEKTETSFSFYGEDGLIEFVQYLTNILNLTSSTEIGFGNDIIGEISKHKDFKKPSMNFNTISKMDLMKVEGSEGLCEEYSFSRIENADNEYDPEPQDSILELSFTNFKSLRMSSDRPIFSNSIIELPKIDCFQYYTTLAFYMEEYCPSRIESIFSLYIKSAEKNITNFPFIQYNQFVEKLSYIEISKLIKYLQNSTFNSSSKCFKEIFKSGYNKKALSKESTNAFSVLRKNRYSFILNILQMRKEKLKSAENCKPKTLRKLSLNAAVQFDKHENSNKHMIEVGLLNSKDEIDFYPSSDTESNFSVKSQKPEAFEGKIDAEKILNNLKQFNVCQDALLKKSILNTQNSGGSIISTKCNNTQNLQQSDCLSIIEEICFKINQIIIKFGLEKFKLEPNNCKVLGEINTSADFSDLKVLIANLSLINLGQLSLRNLKNPKSLALKTKMLVCLWLNLYNYLTLYTIFLKKEFISHQYEWSKMAKNSFYDIGGIVISLYEIEQFILKQNDGLKNSDNFTKLLNNPDAAQFISIPKLPKFLNFGIVIPSKCSPALRVYFPVYLEEKLQANTYDYLTCNLNVEIDQTIIFIPEYLNTIDENFKENIHNYEEILPLVFFKYLSLYQISMMKADWNLNFSYFKSSDAQNFG